MPSGTVLVTGASSGIGEATAIHLREVGFTPIAGVRKDEDAERLEGLGLRTLKLDVTDSDRIAAASESLGDAPLAGLVNNAGIAVAAPLEFLPALRSARGRIVNVSSIGGRVALPLVGAYNASKFGLEGASDALRRELRSHGVDVILIEPGGVKTPIWKKGEALADEITEDLPPEAERLYGRLIARVRAETRRIDEELGSEPRAVAEAIATALTARRPRARYLVGSDARQRAVAAKLLPARVMDRMIGRALDG
jgi:NAD(P)-dependent dehydrogenase (short-subunit alcohol dehydrogenase family)